MVLYHKVWTLIKYGKSIVLNQINETVLTTIIMEHWFTLDKKYDTIPETMELWFTIEITMAHKKNYGSWITMEKVCSYN